MKATFLKGVALGAAVSSVTLIASAAFAGSGVGAIFNLGKYNAVNGTTELAGSTAGSQLNVVNTSNGASAAGIAIKVHGGKPPLTVNSSTQVQNLNASYLQGKKASAFVQGTGSVTGGSIANLSYGGFTGLGAVGSFGGLTAYCGTGGFTYAAIKLETAKTQLIFYWPNAGPSGTYLAPSGSSSTIGADTPDGQEMVQFTSGTEVATATLSWGWGRRGPGTCDFVAQVVDTQL